MLQEVVFVDDPVDEDAASVRDGVVIECRTLLTLEVEGVADMMSGTPAVDRADRRADAGAPAHPQEAHAGGMTGPEIEWRASPLANSSLVNNSITLAIMETNSVNLASKSTGYDVCTRSVTSVALSTIFLDRGMLVFFSFDGLIGFLVFFLFPLVDGCECEAFSTGGFGAKFSLV